jgi:hypothetical protein
LIVDELGFVPLSKIGAEPLFELIGQRLERASTVIKTVIGPCREPPRSPSPLSPRNRRTDSRSRRPPPSWSAPASDSRSSIIGTANACAVADPTGGTSLPRPCRSPRRRRLQRRPRDGGRHATRARRARMSQARCAPSPGPARCVGPSSLKTTSCRPTAPRCQVTRLARLSADLSSDPSANPPLAEQAMHGSASKGAETSLARQ